MFNPRVTWFCLSSAVQSKKSKSITSSSTLKASRTSSCSRLKGSFPACLSIIKIMDWSPSIGVRDTQTGMLPGGPKSAICVQKFDDSLISAIHITYRSWLRSSSMHEPRDPPLKVVYQLYFQYTQNTISFKSAFTNKFRFSHAHL